VVGLEGKRVRARKSMGGNNSAVKMPLIALIMSHAEGKTGNADLARTLGLNPGYARKACLLKQLHVREVLSRRISSCKS
jgi:hypothetical protein